MAKSKDEDIRIFELPEATSLPAGMYVAVDNETLGTKKYNISEALDSMATSADVEEIRGELESKADSSDVAALATTVDGKADEVAMTTALAGKEDKVFVAEVNVTSYDDIDTAYNDGKTIVFKYQPSPQGNPGLVYYIKNMQYVPYAGYMCGTFNGMNASYFIVCRKNNDETIWTVSDVRAMYSPTNSPSSGQILTFDGTNNVWSAPPEGVYMLKYSEVTNIDDVDLDKATTVPTFILIDSKQTLVIGNGSSGTTITVNAGTIMRLEEVGASDDAGKPMLLTFVNDYGNSATGSTYMTYGNYFVRLVVSKSMYGGVSKKFGVSADIWDSNLFRSQPVPVVKKYDIARGPAESMGSLNGDSNSLIVSFEDTGSNKRRQLLPPAELATHDFSSDAITEQIQFMGWGSISNRAGYRTINEVPVSTSADQGKVLTVDSNGGPGWDYPEDELPSYNSQTLVGTYLSVCSGSNNNELRWEEVSAGRGLSTRQDTYQGHSTKVIEVDSRFVIPPYSIANAGMVLAVNASGTGLEWISPGSNVPANALGVNGEPLGVNGDYVTVGEGQ